MVQIVCTLLLFMVIIIPIGNYVYHVSVGKRTFADPVFDKMDNFVFRILKIDTSTMTWKKYAMSLLMVNLCLVFIGYLILRIQSIGFLNPNGISGMEESLSFNTIISFMTNTNLQHYAGESGLSYLSQMLVIIMMMFTSAATGFSACIAMIRGLLGKKMGNFYVDFIRIINRFLLPLSMIIGLFLVWQGVPQNLNSNIELTTIEGKIQEIASGPIAALESIKHLGTNGGGFLGANSATPLENPTIITNIIELFSMMILPVSCIFVFGGAGVGLMNMLIYAIIAVFICGLMIGRTPEYLGKKIEGKEMKLAALCIIIHPLLILGFSALAVSIPEGVNGITNPSFHGLSQVLYEFASSAANNGSGFEGLVDNSLFWNMSCGIVMFLARYLPIIIQLGIAGSLMNKIDINESTGTLKTNTLTFAIILVIVVYIFAALTFLPAIALGPVAEMLTL